MPASGPLTAETPALGSAPPKSVPHKASTALARPELHGEKRGRSKAAAAAPLPKVARKARRGCTCRGGGSRRPARSFGPQFPLRLRSARPATDSSRETQERSVSVTWRCCPGVQLPPPPAPCFMHEGERRVISSIFRSPARERCFQVSPGGSHQRNLKAAALSKKTFLGKGVVSPPSSRAFETGSFFKSFLGERVFLLSEWRAL